MKDYMKEEEKELAQELASLVKETIHTYYKENERLFMENERLREENSILEKRLKTIFSLLTKWGAPVKMD